MAILTTDSFDDMIAWLPHGRGFMIHRKEEFAANVLPLYFPKESKFASFTRRLSRWGFHRIRGGADKGVYHHLLFRKGNYELCLQMHCVSKSLKNDLNDPEFYTEDDNTLYLNDDPSQAASKVYGSNKIKTPVQTDARTRPPMSSTTNTNLSACFSNFPNATTHARSYSLAQNSTPLFSSHNPTPMTQVVLPFAQTTGAYYHPITTTASSIQPQPQQFTMLVPHQQVINPFPTHFASTIYPTKNVINGTTILAPQTVMAVAAPQFLQPTMIVPQEPTQNMQHTPGAASGHAVTLQHVNTTHTGYVLAPPTAFINPLPGMATTASGTLSAGMGVGIPMGANQSIMAVGGGVTHGTTSMMIPSAVTSMMIPGAATPTMLPIETTSMPTTGATTSINTVPPYFQERRRMELASTANPTPGAKTQQMGPLTTLYGQHERASTLTPLEMEKGPIIADVEQKEEE